MKYFDLISGELDQARQVLQAFMSAPDNIANLQTVAEKMATAIINGGKIISCGNGGSHCDAMHFAEELTGRYRDNRPALPAIAISDPSHISCVSNDFGYQYVFSRYVEGLGNKGDVLLGISTSGNSANVIEAIKAATKKGMVTVVLSGNDGGQLAALADCEVRVPHHGYADRIQEVHIKIIHILILLIEKMVSGYRA